MTSLRIDYKNVICIPETPDYERVRYILRKKGNNPLFIVGLNSSSADQYDYDPTVRKAIIVAEKRKFDGFVMLNLYPLRQTDPKDLPRNDEKKYVGKNIDRIQEEFSEIKKEVNEDFKPTILAAWGTNVIQREYLRQSLGKIVNLFAKQEAKWLHFGELTKDGHPRHPLYTKNTAELSAFDIDEYMDKIDKYMKKLK